MYTYRFADDLGEVLARFRRIRRSHLYKVSEFLKPLWGRVFGVVSRDHATFLKVEVLDCNFP
jgi:hypothetical protein